MTKSDINSLFKVPSGSLAPKKTGMSVGTLERMLLQAFPKEDACSWDKTGLFVGNPAEEITGVVVALDPTIPTLKKAYELGANVVLTHHPVFIDAPDNFLPAAIQGATPGAVINYALSHNINCMAFHTACDVSKKGLAILPAMLRLNQGYVLDPLAGSAEKGFGMVCTCGQENPTLEQLAARCVSVFNALPRVWGNAKAHINTVATCGGAATSLISACLESSLDCLICGEVKYHNALEASQSGLSIIELGHDVSELPLCALLATEVLATSLPESCVMIIDQSHNWFTPETIRQ